MRNLFTNASAAAIASIMAAAPAWAQETGAGGSAMPEASGGERAANEITCREIVAMDTATVPGILYFISGHREGSAGAAGASAPAEIGQSDETGVAPDMAASGGGAAGSESPESGEASIAEAPTVGENSPALQQANEAAAANTAGAVTDPGGADAAGTPIQGRDFEAVPDDTASGTTEAADAATESQGFEAAAGQASGGDDQVMLTRVLGHFEIPIEQVMIACAETPDSPAADVVEQQRTPSDMTGGGAAQPEASN